MSANDLTLNKVAKKSSLKPIRTNQALSSSSFIESPTKAKENSPYKLNDINSKLADIRHQLSQSKLSTVTQPGIVLPSVKAKQRAASMSSIGGNMSSSITKSWSPKKPTIHHPKLDYILTEIVYSPYLTKPNVPYSRDLYKIKREVEKRKKNLAPLNGVVDLNEIRQQFEKVISYRDSFSPTEKANSRANSPVSRSGGLSRQFSRFETECSIQDTERQEFGDDFLMGEREVTIEPMLKADKDNSDKYSTKCFNSEAKSLDSEERKLNEIGAINGINTDSKPEAEADIQHMSISNEDLYDSYKLEDEIRSSAEVARKLTEATYECDSFESPVQAEDSDRRSNASDTYEERHKHNNSLPEIDSEIEENLDI